MVFYLHIALTFISLVVNLVLATIILTVDSKNRVNRFYSIFTLCVAYWSIFKILQISADSELLAATFYRWGSIGWTLLPVAYFVFVLEFTKVENRILTYIMYLFFNNRSCIFNLYNKYRPYVERDDT